ncbi:MAG: DUF5665 domain-containing protein [Thermaerobacter sp.]|jgi:predicted PurR-regulated permease PerM|nr:DUF5665 domain-containing protein [Thermaerobacter sp.]
MTAKEWEQALERLSSRLETMHIARYVELLDNPRRLIYLNLLAGLFRGVGMGVGFTLIGAALLYVLKASFMQHLPYVGKVVADIVRIVQLELARRP